MASILLMMIKLIRNHFHKKTRLSPFSGICMADLGEAVLASPEPDHGIGLQAPLCDVAFQIWSGWGHTRMVEE